MSEERWSLLRWSVVAAYFAATSLGHLRFTQWLLKQRESAWWGAYAFKEAVPALLVVAGVALLAWIVQLARRSASGPWATGRFWAVWLSGVVAVDWFLTYSIYEYAHYPQYAILAVLIARALDPGRTQRCTGRVLFWTTLLGMADEVLQYLWITPSYGNYLDFNDFLVNLMGGAAGVALYYRGDLAHAVRWGASREAMTALVLATGIALGLGAGVLKVSPEPGQAIPPGGWSVGSEGRPALYLQRSTSWYGSRQPGHRHAEYWVLSPWMGLSLLGAAAALFAAACAPDRRPALGRNIPFGGGVR